MLERLLIVIALLAGLALLVQLGRAFAQRRVAVLANERPFAGLVPEGVPAVVAFTLPGCADCRARQAPALQRLAVRSGEQAAILTLRADEHAALVDRLGVMTVPATAVLAADGTVRALNQGYADDEHLAVQLGLRALL